MTVTVIGVDGTSLPAGAADVLAAADLVVGAKPHLVAHAPEGVRTLDIDALDATALAGAQAVVLVDGDPSYFGVVRKLRRQHCLQIVCH